MKQVYLGGEVVQVSTADPKYVAALERTLRRLLAKQYMDTLERVPTVRIALASDLLHSYVNTTDRVPEVKFFTLTLNQSDLYL